MCVLYDNIVRNSTQDPIAMEVTNTSIIYRAPMCHPLCYSLGIE